MRPRCSASRAIRELRRPPRRPAGLDRRLATQPARTTGAVGKMSSALLRQATMLSFALGALGFASNPGAPAPPETIDTDHYVAATVDTVRWGEIRTRCGFR
eukprot:scaffold80340_cov32-Tisochrysis_lutea.AAC.1